LLKNTLTKALLASDPVLVRIEVVRVAWIRSKMALCGGLVREVHAVAVPRAVTARLEHEAGQRGTPGFPAGRRGLSRHDGVARGEADDAHAQRTQHPDTYGRRFPGAP
jgi:hypothetical protein